MSFYKKFSDKDLNITDWLAVERTVLANERNLLAYIRTLLSFSVAGVGVIKIFPDFLFLGYLLIIAGVFLFLFGYKHYKSTKEKLSSFKV